MIKFLIQNLSTTRWYHKFNNIAKWIVLAVMGVQIVVCISFFIMENACIFDTSMWLFMVWFFLGWFMDYYSMPRIDRIGHKYVWEEEPYDYYGSY